MSVRRERSGRSVRVSARGKGLLVLVGVVLFAGLFVQVTMLSRVSAQSKVAASLADDIEELGARADNLEMAVNGFHNLEEIRKRAIQLGMEVADGTSTRVVSVTLPDAGESNVQAASAAQGVQN